MKILIVGGGIAGVTLAHQLQKKHQITIIERGAAWRTVGYGVGIFRAGLEVLKKLSLDQDFWNSGYPVNELAILSSKKGALRFQMSIETKEKNTPGMISFERESIHKAVHKKLEGVAVKFNTTIKSIAQTDDGADVEFADGSKETFDLVVGADGIRSTVRSLVFGDNKLKSYGWNVWGAWAPPATQPFQGLYFLSGPRETVFSFPLHGKYAVGLMYKTDDPSALPESKEAMLSRFPLLKSQISDMVSAIDDTSVLLHDTVHYVEMDEWYKNRVVLIGDARHGLSPITGQGTSLALEDAFVLAEELNKNEDIAVALSRFSDRRDARLRSMALFRKIVEMVGMVNSSVFEGVRNVGLRLIPNTVAKLMSYLFRKISA